MDQTCHWNHQGWLLIYLPPAVIGENLIIGYVQLVPLQQKLKLPIPVILILFIGAKGCKRTGKKSTQQTPRNKNIRTIPYGQLSEPFVKGDSKHVLLESNRGTSLVVRCLRLYLPVQGVWVQSLDKKLRFSHALQPKNQNIKSRSNIIRYSLKVFKKWSRFKKKSLKKRIRHSELLFH